MYGGMAMTKPLTSASTPSLRMSSIAAAAPGAGLPSSSATSSSTCRPRIPPAALSSAIASSRPSRICRSYG